MRAAGLKCGRQQAGHADRYLLQTPPPLVSAGDCHVQWPALSAISSGVGQHVTQQSQPDRSLQGCDVPDNHMSHTDVAMCSSFPGGLTYHSRPYRTPQNPLTTLVDALPSNVQVIPGKEDSSISCLAWVKDPVDASEALISGGLDGILTEWDLVTRAPRHLGDSFGGAVWDIAVEPASQTEQGAMPCFMKQDAVSWIAMRCPLVLELLERSKA